MNFTTISYHLISLPCIASYGLLTNSSGDQNSVNTKKQEKIPNPFVKAGRTADIRPAVHQHQYAGIFPWSGLRNARGSPAQP